MSAQASNYSKEELEKQKLLAEINNLKRSWIKLPASWVSIITIIVALFGLGFQYRNHKMEEIEAQNKLKDVTQNLKVVQTELDKKEPRLKQIDDEITNATTNLNQLTSEREEVQTQLEALNAKLKDLETKANNLPNTAENKNIQETLKTASVTVIDLQKKNRAIEDKSKGITENLGKIKARTSIMRP